MFLLFSHKLTEDQITDAKNNLKVDKIIYLPSDLQELWENIPPTNSSLFDFLAPFRKFIKENSKPKDYVLIQGEFGAVYLMVKFVFSMNLIPLYSTTDRNYSEKRRQNNKVELKHVFKHEIFRKYEN